MSIIDTIADSAPRATGVSYSPAQVDGADAPTVKHGEGDSAVELQLVTRDSDGIPHVEERPAREGGKVKRHRADKVALYFKLTA